MPTNHVWNYDSINSKQTLGERLREAREQLEISQATVLNLVDRVNPETNIAPSTISLLEVGKSGLTEKKLTAYLGAEKYVPVIEAALELEEGTLTSLLD